MAMRRSTQILILGLAIFTIGAGVVVVSFLGAGDEANGPALPATTTTLQAGTVVVKGAAGATPTSFTIPEGKQAVAVQVSRVAGLAGYAKSGDIVNVYGNIQTGKAGTNPPPPSTKLILAGVEVLAVAEAAPGSADTGNATYLLALDAAEAEQAIFFARFESLWLTLVPQGQPKPSTTPGRTYTNAF